MKKTSIIAVLLCYLLAFVIVGFFGMKLTVKDPVSYVDSIEWDIENIRKDHPEIPKNDLTIEFYTEEKDIESNGCNAMLFFIKSDFGKGLTFNFRIRSLPLTADNSLLTFFMPKTEETKNFDYKIKEDNTVDVTFFTTTQTKLKATSTDGKNLTYIINIYAIEA